MPVFGSRSSSQSDSSEVWTSWRRNVQERRRMGEKRVTCRIYRGKGGQGGTKGTWGEVQEKNEKWKEWKELQGTEPDEEKWWECCYVKETIRSVFKANLLRDSNVLDGSSTTWWSLPRTHLQDTSGLLSVFSYSVLSLPFTIYKNKATTANCWGQQKCFKLEFSKPTQDSGSKKFPKNSSYIPLKPTLS